MTGSAKNNKKVLSHGNKDIKEAPGKKMLNQYNNSGPIGARPYQLGPYLIHWLTWTYGTRLNAEVADTDLKKVFFFYNFGNISDPNEIMGKK